jgi:putative acetyltransferase
VREDELTAQSQSNLATIRNADSARDIELARALFVEYAQWLKVDLCFQGFDEELAKLPGAYAPLRGRLLLAGTPGDAFACIALRPLDAGAQVGEVKRLYVRPAHRGEGWGLRLAQALLGEARAIGYRELKLDTLGWMAPARKLYTELGFRECAPYYHNPLPGVVYMSLLL